MGMRGMAVGAVLAMPPGLLRENEPAPEPEPVEISADVPGIDLVDIFNRRRREPPLLLHGEEAGPAVVLGQSVTVLPGGVPVIEQFARDNAHRVTVIGVNTAGWETLEKGRAFVTTHRFSFTNLWDGSDGSLEHYGVTATPSKRLLDRHGDEIGAWQGLTINLDEIEDLLDGLE